MQQVTLTGNLGSDPEMKYLPDGTPVTTFSLAVNKNWVDKAGNKQSKTTWWRVSCWRKTAENAAKYLHKGSKVLIVGDDVEARAWTDKDGSNRASLEVTANTVEFLDGKEAAGNVAPGAGAVDEENIPF